MQAPTRPEAIANRRELRRLHGDAGRRTRALLKPEAVGRGSCEAAQLWAAIVQPAYIPWKGYFDLINAVEEFILFEDVQYTRKSWKNRNVIKTRRGPQWLSIPVRVTGRSRQLINEVEIASPRWAREHWKSLVHSYAKAPHFDRYAEDLRALYERCVDLPDLASVDREFVVAICRMLGIDTRISSSAGRAATSRGTPRVVELCRAVGATHFLSGPTAKAYLDAQAFADAGVELVFISYEGYPPYPQLYPPFIHNVTVLDLLLNTGPESRSYMKSFGGSRWS